MCRPTVCRTCGRTTWAGCGQHVAQVRAAVPADQWCSGHPKAAKAARKDPQAGGWLGGLRSRLTGR